MKKEFHGANNITKMFQTLEMIFVTILRKGFIVLIVVKN